MAGAQEKETLVVEEASEKQEILEVEGTLLAGQTSEEEEILVVQEMSQPSKSSATMWMNNKLVIGNSI